ncbi:uncharacterized protein EAF01_011408 [Botrytis porri]|uniref:uncharacterized protein n=1 Tax=Botrytis porri TaxID=87229 RepID=UPI0019023086|nr:uncharacterized protein EAF01_011408 [Botrytis porri]KAF7885343.1 hypothetical protein EAF01_011408 [Botrytis porri]
MPTSPQPRDAAAQTDEDIFFDAPEELFEDALESQNGEEIKCIDKHAYLANPDKDHYPDLPAYSLQRDIEKFYLGKPAPFEVEDPEFAMLLGVEDCLINLQQTYEMKMKKEDSKFRRIMALYEKVTNRPHDPSRMLTPKARKKERTLYVRRLNEITRVQKLMDREYLVEFREIKKDAVAIMDRWHAKQSSLAAVPHKLVVEEHIRWTLLRQKQLEYIHDKTKNLVNDQANQIRGLEYALAVAQQAAAATPFIYLKTSSMIQEQVLAEANNMTPEQILADAYKKMVNQRQMNHGGQNAVQPNADIAQVDDVAILNRQEQLSAGEDLAQAQQPHGLQNQGKPELVADSGEVGPSTIPDRQQEALEDTNIPQSQQPSNFQYQERSKVLANTKNHDDDTISNGQTEMIEEGEIAGVEQPVEIQQQEIPEPDTNLPQDQSNLMTPNGQEQPIATGANISQGQEYSNSQSIHYRPPPLDAAVPIIPNRQMKQHSYVHYMEYEGAPGRMYAVHSSDPVKKAWARKMVDLDFEKKQRDIVDEIMKTGRNEVALKKWSETVSRLTAGVSSNRRATKHNIQDFDENEESDDEFGRKRTFGTYEEDEEFEEEHSRKRVCPITQIPCPTLVRSRVFEPTPEDSGDEDMWEEPATGYFGHDGVYYDPDGRCQNTQAYAGQEYFDPDVNDEGYPVRQYTPPPSQQRSPSPQSAPASRIRSYSSRYTATKRNSLAPASLSRQRMLRSQWSQLQNNRTTQR